LKYQPDAGRAEEAEFAEKIETDNGVGAERSAVGTQLTSWKSVYESRRKPTAAKQLEVEKHAADALWPGQKC
jgi:hypothetical protein